MPISKPEGRRLEAEFPAVFILMLGFGVQGSGEG